MGNVIGQQLKASPLARSRTSSDAIDAPANLSPEAAVARMLSAPSPEAIKKVKLALARKRRMLELQKETFREKARELLAQRESASVAFYNEMNGRSASSESAGILSKQTASAFGAARAPSKTLPGRLNVPSVNLRHIKQQSSGRQSPAGPLTRRSASTRSMLGTPTPRTARSPNRSPRRAVTQASPRTVTFSEHPEAESDHEEFETAMSTTRSDAESPPPAANRGAQLVREDTGPQRMPAEQLRRCFSHWTIDAVQFSYEKISSMIGGQLDSSVRISRRQFFDVFGVADLNVLTVDQTYLGLPLDVFECFTRHKGDQTALLYEILVVLVLLSNSEDLDKLQFLFDSFDFDHSDTLEINELIDMVDMCALALFKLGELTTPVTSKQLEEIAADTFMVIDEDGSNRISWDEFVEWSSRNRFVRGVLRSFRPEGKQHSGDTTAGNGLGANGGPAAVALTSNAQTQHESMAASDVHTLSAALQRHEAALGLNSQTTQARDSSARRHSDVREYMSSSPPAVTSQPSDPQKGAEATGVPSRRGSIELSSKARLERERYQSMVEAAPLFSAADRGSLPVMKFDPAGFTGAYEDDAWRGATGSSASSVLAAARQGTHSSTSTKGTRSPVGDVNSSVSPAGRSPAHQRSEEADFDSLSDRQTFTSIRVKSRAHQIRLSGREEGPGGLPVSLSSPQLVSPLRRSRTESAASTSSFSVRVTTNMVGSPMVSMQPMSEDESWSPRHTHPGGSESAMPRITGKPTFANVFRFSAPAMEVHREHRAMQVAGRSPSPAARAASPSPPRKPVLIATPLRRPQSTPALAVLSSPMSPGPSVDFKTSPVVAGRPPRTAGMADTRSLSSTTSRRTQQRGHGASSAGNDSSPVGNLRSRATTLPIAFPAATSPPPRSKRLGVPRRLDPQAAGQLQSIQARSSEVQRCAQSPRRVATTTMNQQEQNVRQRAQARRASQKQKQLEHQRREAHKLSQPKLFTSLSRPAPARRGTGFGSSAGREGGSATVPATRSKSPRKASSWHGGSSPAPGPKSRSGQSPHETARASPEALPTSGSLRKQPSSTHSSQNGYESVAGPSQHQREPSSAAHPAPTATSEVSSIPSSGGSDAATERPTVDTAQPVEQSPYRYLPVAAVDVGGRQFVAPLAGEAGEEHVRAGSHHHSPYTPLHFIRGGFQDSMTALSPLHGQVTSYTPDKPQLVFRELRDSVATVIGRSPIQESGKAKRLTSAGRKSSKA